MYDLRGLDAILSARRSILLRKSICKATKHRYGNGMERNHTINELANHQELQIESNKETDSAIRLCKKCHEHTTVPFKVLPLESLPKVLGCTHSAPPKRSRRANCRSSESISSFQTIGRQCQRTYMSGD